MPQSLFRIDFKYQFDSQHNKTRGMESQGIASLRIVILDEPGVILIPIALFSLAGDRAQKRTAGDGVSFHRN